MKLAVFFGSQACEHDVSVVTALQAMDNADAKYEIIPVYMGRDGRWFTGEALRKIEFYRAFDEKKVTPCLLAPAPDGRGQLVRWPVKSGLFAGSPVIAAFDVALLALHGMNGEDGTLQGLLELYNIPYTSSGVLGSATGMDKIAMKLIFRGCGFPVLDMCWFDRQEWEKNRNEVLERVERSVGYPAFVKPANLGSSIGISKAVDRQTLEQAIDVAVHYDRRILVEVGVTEIMEVNCAALGYGDEAIASVCESPVSWQEFLTFEDKYLRGGKSGKTPGGKGMQSLARQIPAPISKEMTAQIQEMTVNLFKVMDLKGVVRVDYIVDKASGQFYVNEVNTIPGSLAFYLFEPLGVSFAQLIGRMVDSALAAHREKRKSAFSFDSQLLNKAGMGSKR